MKKGKYTHVQALLAEGKTQREAAEYGGFQDKQVIKGLFKRASTSQGTAEERCCTQRHCAGAGIRDPAVRDGKQAAAGFPAIHRREVRTEICPVLRLPHENETWRS